MALELHTPMGPGFFIFFQNPVEEIYSGPRVDNLEAIRRDDQEVLELMIILVNCCEFD
jgi:hypothetical protein